MPGMKIEGEEEQDIPGTPDTRNAQPAEEEDEDLGLPDIPDDEPVHIPGPTIEIVEPTDEERGEVRSEFKIDKHIPLPPSGFPKKQPSIWRSRFDRMTDGDSFFSPNATTAHERTIRAVAKGMKLRIAIRKAGSGNVKGIRVWRVGKIKPKVEDDNEDLGLGD